MNFRLVYQPEAYAELEQAIAWSFQHYPESACEWCSGLLDAIESLATTPLLHPLAREKHLFTQEIRQLHFGRGRSVYRILYTVDDELVRVLHIRFPGQPLLD